MSLAQVFDQLGLLAFFSWPLCFSVLLGTAISTARVIVVTIDGVLELLRIEKLRICRITR